MGRGCVSSCSACVSWCTAVSLSWNCSALDAELHSLCASTIAPRSGLKLGPRVGCGTMPGTMPGIPMCIPPGAGGIPGAAGGAAYGAGGAALGYPLHAAGGTGGGA